jgi:hypothetical protein
VAAVNNVTVMPPTFYNGPGLLVGTHVSAARGSDDTMIEWRYIDLEAQIYGDALTVEHGRCRYRRAPGSEWIPTLT